MSMDFLLLKPGSDEDYDARATIPTWLYQVGQRNLIPRTESLPILRRVWGPQETILPREDIPALREELERLQTYYAKDSAESGDAVKRAIALADRAIVEGRAILVSGD